jgi:hypothetical protein
MNTDTLTYLMFFLNAEQLNNAVQVSQQWKEAYQIFTRLQLSRLHAKTPHIKTFLDTTNSITRHALLLSLTSPELSDSLLSTLSLLKTMRESPFSAFNESPNDELRSFYTSEAGILLVKQKWINLNHTEGFESNYHLYASRLNKRKKNLLLCLMINKTITTQTLIQFPKPITQLISPKLVYALKKQLLRGEHFRLNNLKKCFSSGGFYLLKRKHLTPEQIDEMPKICLIYLLRPEARPLFTEQLISLEFFNTQHPNPLHQPHFTRKCWNRLLTQICKEIKYHQTKRLFTFLRSEKPKMENLLQIKSLNSHLTQPNERNLPYSMHTTKKPL